MDSPGDAIARRDELLELLYWIEGEGFQGAATFESMTRFLATPPDQVRATLADLVRRGEVEEHENGEYRLSKTGRGEAARRFAEEFAPLLSQGHGECNDPNCECHTDPHAAAECHAGHGRSQAKD
jgi:hypothetical protein